MNEMDAKHQAPVFGSKKKTVFANVGLYRSGSTTFAKAAELAGFQVNRSFPRNISANELKQMLVNPRGAVTEWWKGRGKEELKAILDGLHLYETDTPALIGDGWICLVPYLDIGAIDEIIIMCFYYGVILKFLATTRREAPQVLSELHHWVVHDIESKAGLAPEERSDLENALKKRWLSHTEALQNFSKKIAFFPLEEIDDWARHMASLTEESNFGKNRDWCSYLHHAGHQNCSRKLPLEGILLTLRLHGNTWQTLLTVKKLFKSLERDSLCRMVLVVALDHDEAQSSNARRLKELIKQYNQFDVIEFITNTPRNLEDTFPICEVWDRMACVAYERGADWTMLLGDDVEIRCPYHYRALYRAFLDTSKKRGHEFGFGCPWWNDESFPGFPTFPVVGKAHYKIFQSLIPSHRKQGFVNQDLDPYLQRLYLQFGCAPVIHDARLVNTSGGSHLNPTRYKRVSAIGWRDWVLDDVQIIRSHLNETKKKVTKECLLVDVIVPTYRINQAIIRNFCLLTVPEDMRSVLIIVVDNPDKLCKETNTKDIHQAASIMESMLRSFTQKEKCLNNDPTALLGENVRVRCNATNLGASESRNRGIDESSAQYVLFLDDDVHTIDNSLLSMYHELLTDKTPSDCVGFVGLVQFPRRANLPVIHGAVLMSYLTYVFEIARNPMYKNPAWGVTANILVKRTKVRFDSAYAKTGGGEDVDFCLRLLESCGQQQGQLYAAPTACVVHDYWDGGVIGLMNHFFNWAIGDGALFRRFPVHSYWSYPNAVEFLIIFLSVWTASAFISGPKICFLLSEVVLIITTDLLCDMVNRKEFQHRCNLLGEYDFSIWYYITAHALANIYVIVLECGRLYGHWKRGDIYYNVTRRFDWHCGRLKNSPKNFIRSESRKFVLFVLVSFLNAALCL